MFCRKCGVQLGENGICPKCGYVYEPMYKEYMNSWFEQGKTLSLPSMNSVAHAKTQVHIDEKPPVHTENNYQQPAQPVNTVYHQPSAYTQYYQQNPVTQQVPEKKVSLTRCAWFAPVALVVFFLVYAFISTATSSIINNIYFDAFYSGYNDAYLSSITITATIILTCVELILLPLLSVIFFNLAFMKVEKKKKRALSILILVPIILYWIASEITGIINSTLNMWLNAGMTSTSFHGLSLGVFAFLLLTISAVVSFFICRSAIKKLEESWQ